MFIGYGVTTGLLVRNGGGTHQWNLRVKEAINAAYVCLYVHIFSQLNLIS